MLTFFTPFDVKMIQISTFPAAPSTERVPSLAERVASLRYSINLRFLNNRVPALVCIVLRHIHEIGDTVRDKTSKACHIRASLCPIIHGNSSAG